MNHTYIDNEYNQYNADVIKQYANAINIIV